MNALTYTEINDELLHRVEEEMLVTREFLADWFAGRLDRPKDSQDFYLNRVLAKNFNTIRPDGTRLDREQTLNGFFEDLHASEPNVLRHENLNIRTLSNDGNIAVIQYDEKHVYTDHDSTNALTAVFLRNDSAPHGVSWLVVHETPVN